MLKSYLITCISGIIFLTFVEFILPRGKNGAAVRTVISILAVSIIVIPIISFLKSGVSDNFSYSSDYFLYGNKVEQKTQLNEVKLNLILNGLKCESISIDSDEEGKIKNVLIFFKKTGIESESESINISEKAKDIAVKILEIERSAIDVKFLDDVG